MKGDFGLMSRKTSICVTQVCIIKLVAYPWNIGLLFFVFRWFQGYFHCFVFWYWICNCTGSFVSLCVFLILLFFFWFVLCIYAFFPSLWESYRSFNVVSPPSSVSFLRETECSQATSLNEIHLLSSLCTCILCERNSLADSGVLMADPCINLPGNKIFSCSFRGTAPSSA